jgi:hypothetical protein
VIVTEDEIKTVRFTRQKRLRRCDEKAVNEPAARFTFAAVFAVSDTSDLQSIRREQRDGMKADREFS